MIVSFKDQRTKALYDGVFVKGLPDDLRRRAQIKLRMLDAAVSFTDLRVPPANKLETLKGKLKGYHSVRVNNQWRLVFRWAETGAEDVWFIDYH